LSSVPPAVSSSAAPPWPSSTRVTPTSSPPTLKCLVGRRVDWLGWVGNKKRSLGDLFVCSVLSMGYLDK
jgi:hypothetical protein